MGILAWYVLPSSLLVSYCVVELTRNKAPEMDAYFGLTFIVPRLLSKIIIVGSHDLANIVGWEATGSNPQAWEILTLSTPNEGWVNFHFRFRLPELTRSV